MVRLQIDIAETLHDALGFGVGRLDDVLRVAWFPLLLITALPYALVELSQAGLPGAALIAGHAVVTALLTASFMVPLTRYAALGETPHRSSMHFAIGGRHIRFALVSFLSVAAALVVAGGPVVLAVQLADRVVADMPVTEVFVFDEGSLHGGDVNVLLPNTGPIRDIQALLLQMILPLGLLYLFIRLFLWPFFLAAGGPGAPAPLALSLSASSGSNGLRLLLVVAVLFLLQVVVSFGANLVVGIGHFGAGILGTLLAIVGDLGLDFAAPGWGQAVSQGFGVVVSVIAAVIVSAFTGGVIAGAAGSIVRRVRG